MKAPMIMGFAASLSGGYGKSCRQKGRGFHATSAVGLQT
jgi:hypothetical protein